jgi:hypothetical protein
MALPLLEGMAPLASVAQAATSAAAVRAAKAAPAARLNRMVFIFVPNGMHMADWKPAAEGANYALPYILEPLKKFAQRLLGAERPGAKQRRALGRRWWRSCAFERDLADRCASAQDSGCRY